MKYIGGILLFLSLINLMYGKIINVPEEETTLNNALERAVDGDTIMLAPGTYTQPEHFYLNKAVLVTSQYLLTHRQSDIEKTIIDAGSDDMAEWFEITAENAKVSGIRFVGNEEHTLHITAPFATVTYCQFIGGKDQLSITGGGGHVSHCYFENAGDDGIDCDNSTSWTIEHNLIVNAFQDGIEVRLHEKEDPMTTHIFRYNEVVGSGESGIQLIDYQGNSYREFYIHNNVFRNCQGAGVSCMYQEMDNTNEVYRGSLMEESAFVYNNTFIKCHYGLTISPGLIILNNIFAGLTGKGIERGIYVNDANDQSVVDFCLFFDNPEHFTQGIIHGDHILVDQDPLLNEIYVPEEGSPCIDRGTDQYQWRDKTFQLTAEDFHGQKPDLGAKEFGGSGWMSDPVPVLDAGKDLLILAPVNWVQLKASVADLSILADDPLLFRWEKLSGPGEVTFSDATRPETRAEFSRQGMYELRLRGENDKIHISDRLVVRYVRDFKENTFSAGNNRDVFIPAAEYRYLVGPVESLPSDGDDKKTLTTHGDQKLWAYGEYKISTVSPATYYIWIHLSSSDSDDYEVFVAFNDLKNEKKISWTGNGRKNIKSWHKVSFENIPEGSYPLRIRAEKKGVMWDQVFLTTDPDRQP